MTTERQIAANRINGLKGGVKTEAGKAISRLNARKEGIFAKALTDHDSESLRGLLEELNEELKPVGTVERILVDKLAVTWLRMQRCAQAESKHYLEDWNSRLGEPGKFRYHEKVVAIGLYDARLTKQFLRLLKELEWRQEKRMAQSMKPQIAQILQMENEPNSAAETAQANLAKVSTNLRKVDRLEPEPAKTSGLDYADCETENGVGRKEAQEAQETKNEPNAFAMPIAECRMPSDDPETKNEPNLSQPQAAGEVARRDLPGVGEPRQAGCQGTSGSVS